MARIWQRFLFQFSRSFLSDICYLPVYHQLPELTQTHVHWVCDAIQSSHSLLFPSLPVEPVQHRSSQWTLRTDLIEDGLVGSPCSPRDSQESAPTPQFKSIKSSALSLLHSPTLTSIHDHWKKQWAWLDGPVGKGMSLLFNMLSRLVITFLPRSKHLIEFNNNLLVTNVSYTWLLVKTMH